MSSTFSMLLDACLFPGPREYSAWRVAADWRCVAGRRAPARRGSIPPSTGTAASGLARSASGSLLRDASSGSPSGLSSSYENAVRDIQTGLMRCITQLVATARSGAGEERMVEMGGGGGASEVDVLLTRSLCEVVRLAEETATL